MQIVYNYFFNFSDICCVTPLKPQEFNLNIFRYIEIFFICFQNVKLSAYFQVLLSTPKG